LIFLASARVYEELWELGCSELVLDAWYHIHKDQRILRSLIRILCKSGKIHEAYAKYVELKAYDSHALPFIVYKGRVENDDELKEVEDIIDLYIELAHSSSEYIANQTHFINNSIVDLNNKNVDSWTAFEHEEYGRLFFRRLMLMQIDVITLCNPRYIEYYLNDLQKFGLDWTSVMREMLGEFFLSSFSEEVRQEVEMRDEKDILESSNDEQWMPDSPNTVYEDISLHIARTWELFSQPGFFETQRDRIFPLLELSKRRVGQFDETLESDIHKTLLAFKDQSDYYDSLILPIRNNYENFLQNIDNKYGVFYRRHLQSFAINPNISPEEYPEVLRDYPDIALLFWSEKIISW
jgi:hypothetical protein